MKQLTAKDILKIAKGNLSIEDFAEGYYDPKDYGFGEVVMVEQKGGEDQGSDYYTVRHFVDHNVYIKTRGFYSSYHGTDWDFGYGEEVFPKVVEITIYTSL